MRLEIVQYGHPVLRKKGATIAGITPEIRQLAEDMLDTMYANHGVGLAAQQVGHALQLTVLDVREATDRPSSLELDGQPVPQEGIAKFMPLVLINPEITPSGPLETGTEGCLSFPELFADISRASSLDVTALDKEGKRLQFRCGGLLARAIQHEVDHLNGILFIDRMPKANKDALREQLNELQAHTKAALVIKS